MTDFNGTYDYDVIIVGGRPAGSTLAARLGRQGLRVLLLERATFPSLPAVSSPIIYAPTMRLLDEIGADETAYAAGTPKIHRMVQALTPDTAFDIPIPDYKGRDYAYAVERARFDAALWDTAVCTPNVTGWQGFSVTDLIRDGDRVCGIVGTDADKAPHRLTSALVVGADGRFSLVARKANARTRDEHEDLPTSIYYAYWQDLHPFDDRGAAAVAYAGEPGIGYLVMDSADNTAAVCVEGRSDIFENDPRDATALYHDLLARHPALSARLQGAQPVTTVRGMRRIANLYRQPGGAGWALVGDAYHQKDPLDGQGIYNAVFSAKALAVAIDQYRRGEHVTWAEALDWYDETVRIKTYSMYRALISRVQASLYAPAPPEWALTTTLRWLMTDDALRNLLGRFLTRQVPSDALTFMAPPVIAGALVRGGLKDLRDRLANRPRA